MKRTALYLFVLVLGWLFGWDNLGAATIEGNLYDLETLSLYAKRVAIRVVDFRTNTLIRIDDVTDPLNPRRGLLEVVRSDGTFKIEIPDTAQPLRIISVRFRRFEAEVDTQVLGKIVVQSGHSYHLDVTVPKPLTRTCCSRRCARRPHLMCRRQKRCR